MARIVVERQDKWFPDGLRSYRIGHDGEKVGRVKRGETVTINMGAGHHELHLAIDWVRSPPVELNLAEDEERTIRCWPDGESWIALYLSWTGQGRWIGIDLVGDGRSSR